MRRLGLWGGGAALLLALGLTAASAAAPPPADDDDDILAGPNPAARPRDGWNPFLTRLFGGDNKKPAAKPDKEKDKEKDTDKKAEGAAARPPDAAASLRRLEEVKLRRRQEVCLRL